MKIMVTGANGQVGHCLTEALAKSSIDYLSLDRNQLDISDAGAVQNRVNDYAPDVVINAAAYTAVDKAESAVEEAHKINCIGARNLAEAANSLDAAIFHVSTDYVFAGDALHEYGESDPVNPQSVYGKSKLDGELAVARANQKHIILRTAWVFGEHGNNFVKTMLRLGRTRDSLSIVSDQTGGPTYAGDIAASLLKIANAYHEQAEIEWGVYHFSGQPQTTWFEFAKQIFIEIERAKLYEKAVPDLKPIGTIDYPTAAKRPINSRLNCQKIKKNFGIVPSDWQRALQNIHAYVD